MSPNPRQEKSNLDRFEPNHRPTLIAGFDAGWTLLARQSLELAVGRRGADRAIGGVVHADRGSQFQSAPCVAALDRHGVRASKAALRPERGGTPRLGARSSRGGVTRSEFEAE